MRQPSSEHFPLALTISHTCTAQKSVVQLFVWQHSEPRAHFQHRLLSHPFISAVQLQWEQFPIPFHGSSGLFSNLEKSCESHNRVADEKEEARSLRRWLGPYGSVAQRAGEMLTQQPLHMSCSLGLSKFYITPKSVKKSEIFFIFEKFGLIKFSNVSAYSCAFVAHLEVETQRTKTQQTQWPPFHKQVLTSVTVWPVE